MTTYAQLPSGVIMPEDLARSTMAAMIGNMFPMGNHGAYRSASSSNKNTAGWVTSDGSADADSLADIPTLRRQSRDLIRNEALPAGAVGTMVTGVVGQGVIPQARIDYEFLGLSEKDAEKWERAAERIFHHVASKPTFDSEGKLNFYQQQRLVYRSRLESGDCLALRRYLPRPGKALGVAVQLVEGDRVDTPLELATKENIRAGVEVDENGQATFFHVMQQHPGEALTYGTKFAKIPTYDRRGDPLALMVINRLRPGQTRGVPFLAPVIEMFKQLSRYGEAEVTAAVVSSMFAVFVTTPQAGGTGGPLPPGLLPGQVGMQANAVPAGNKALKMQSGMVVDLLPGEDIKVAEATRPNTAFEPFINAVLSYIGTALGVPREVLLKAYNTSYSAARAAIMDAYRQFLIERDDLITQFCQPVWAWVITEAVARGMLDAPGFFDDPVRRDAWLGTEWIGAPAPQIDPLKEANAAAAWEALGIKSKQDISAEQGKDFDSTFKQRSKEHRMEMEAGLIILPASPGTSPANNQQQPDSRPAQAASVVEDLMAAGELSGASGQQLLDILEAQP